MSHHFTTGYGSMDTHALHLSDGRVNTHHNAGSPYDLVTITDIMTMLANPPTVDKAAAQWMLCSSYHQPDARTHDVQRASGTFPTLAIDVDKGNSSLADVVSALTKVLGADVWAALYSTRGSTESDRKWRVLLPLAEALTGAEFSSYQAALFDGMEFAGITCDRTLERPAQLVYLPNRGAFYEWATTGANLLNARQHPMASRAAIYQNMAAEVGKGSGKARDEGSRSFLAAFRRKHSIEEMLALYGYQRKGMSDHWRSPYQDGNSYATQNMDDGWFSLSDSDRAAGLGRPSVNGVYGDQFDLYVHFTCKGDRAHAELYARQCLAEEDEARYGLATTQHGQTVHDGLDWVYDIKKGHVPYSARAKEQLARDLEQQAQAERQQTEQFNQQKDEAEQQKWGGAWLEQVPFKVKACEAEWLAWHAPGVIGRIVREKAPNLKRHSLVPALLGAMTGVAYLAQGKFISVWNQHKTPAAMLCYLVGGSSSGKSDAVSTVYDVINMVKDQHNIKAAKMRDFGSGQAVIDFMANACPDVLLLQNEGGAKRAAGKGDKWQEGVMSETTDIATAFEDGVEGGHTKTGGTSKPVTNPSLGALLTSTPGKLFDSIKSADAESGWLGRNLFVPLRSTLTVENRKPAHYTPETIAYLNRLADVPPALFADHVGVWNGRERSFHCVYYSDETDNLLKQVSREFDLVSIDERRGEAERAVYGRANELLNRLTFILGLGHDFTANVPLSVAAFADQFNRVCLGYVTSQMDTIVEVEELSPGARLRATVAKYYKKAADEIQFRKTFGTGARLNVDNKVEITKAKLRRKLLDNTDSSSRLVNEELDAMIDNEILLVIPDPFKPRSVWLRFVDAG